MGSGDGAYARTILPFLHVDADNTFWFTLLPLPTRVRTRDTRAVLFATRFCAACHGYVVNTSMVLHQACCT